MIASGLLGSDPYYRGPYDGGALYFILKNVPLAPISVQRISTTLTQVISSFEVEHLSMVRSFLSDLKLPFDEQPGLVRTTDGAIRIEFDALGRISNIQSSQTS